MSSAVEAAAKAIRNLEYWEGNDRPLGRRPDRQATAVLSAALPHLTEGLSVFIDDWYDRWAGPGESWTAEDLATAITEELKRRVES